MSTSIADRLRAGTMLGAEGYVFELERRGYIKAGPVVPEVVLDFPEAVRELHREFLRAGADVMVALTYYAHREKLRDVGRADDLEAMNRQGGGSAFVISETNDYLGEALIALEIIKELGLPAMVTLAPTQPDRTRDGYGY